MKILNSRAPSVFTPFGAATYPPVSVGELSSYNYQVPLETITENIAAYLEDHPEVPGVILTQNDRLHSMITRRQLFERLAHRFGVELFIRKPIYQLQESLVQESLDVSARAISANTRIHTAVNIALNRLPLNMYDPLVIQYEDGGLRMLDMHVLLTAQSLATENVNNIVSNMNRIEHSIKADIPMDAALDMILDAIKRVTPHHRVFVMVLPDKKKMSSAHDVLLYLSDSMQSQPLIKSVYETRQPVQIADTSAAPQWTGMEFLGKASVWLGLPISSGKNFDGVLSLIRYVKTPFSQNEIDIAKTFAEFLSVAINRSIEQHDERASFEMVQRKFI